MRTTARICARWTPLLALLSLGFTTSAGAVTIYFNDFQGVVGGEWSSTATDAPPANATRKFLGRYAADVAGNTVSLSLAGLAAHTSLSIEFDLYVIQSWDGDGPEGGTPDVWTLGVSGGPVLLHTTFSNFPDVPGGTPGRTQDYPGTYDDVPGGATNAAKTGAVESDTLGYFPGFLDFPGGDSVYHLSFGLAHSASSVTFTFTGSGGGFSNANDESWGLDNVRVTDDNDIAPIPEPGTSVLLGTGLVALARRWRERSQLRRVTPGSASKRRRT